MENFFSTLLPHNNLPKIALLSPSLVEGDAVSNDVVGMYKILSKNLFNTKIFADTSTVSHLQVSHPSKIRSFLSKPSDILVYHHSIGWDYGMELLGNINCKKVVKYHNVTPPEFYQGICEDYASMCRAGRQQLKNLVDISCDLYLADSQYNLEELNSISQEENKGINGSVVFPFHHIDRLQSVEADIDVLKRFKNDKKVNILMVGRLAPNKGYLALISAFNVYHKEYNSNSRLLIVGSQDPRLSKYKEMLDINIKYWNLQDSIFYLGKVSDKALKSYYLVSDLFVTMSEHEGFCVPLVESMSMKLPIIAYGSTAIPYTLGKAGLIWPEANPCLFAGSVDQILKDEHLKMGLGMMGWQRYQEHFTNTSIEKTFMKALQQFL